MKQTVLITGASSGIGYEMAKIFAKNNFDIILVARNANTLHQLAQDLRNNHQVNVAVFAIDITQLVLVNEMIKTIEAENIFVDYLVNNAGIGDYGEFVMEDWSKIYAMIQLNIVSLTYITHIFLQKMKKEGKGRILNVASTAAFQPGPLMAVYYATKSYVLNFSEAISNELVKNTNITVTTLCPGATQSNFSLVANMKESPLFKEKKLPSAAKVAEYGFIAMMQGKRLAIPGFKNKLLVFGVRLMPRNWILAISRNLIEI